MFEIFGVPSQVLFAQLLLGLINGSFYAVLSLGLSIIFGLLNIVNFTHGAQYMLGALIAWMLLNFLGIGYWWALLLAPLLVGLIGIALERTLISRLRDIDHLYGLLLTFGLALIIQGVARNAFGVSGLPYAVPSALSGGANLGFMFLPIYRGWVVLAAAVLCAAVWFAIEKTKLGAYLRASTENAALVEAFGINVSRLITLTYGLGAALAAFAGVLAAPIYAVSPLMGADILIVVFAVVVIGGLGSILGSIVTGFALGIIEGLTKVYYPEASATVIFLIMALVLLIKPAGLFGVDRPAAAPAATATHGAPRPGTEKGSRHYQLVFIGLSALLIVAPVWVYPVFLMKVLCFGLFASAVNLLFGFSGLLSFGHAAFFGGASYVTAHAAKVWGWPPELSILCGTLVAAVIGGVFGMLSIRRQGIYFAMITLALAQMVFFICLQARFTGGEDGIQAVPRGTLLGFADLSNDLTLYAVVAVIFVAALLAVHRIVTSPFGQVLDAIRGNEARAISLGYRVERYKLTVFVLSAALAGLAGSTKAIVFQLASLTDVHWSMSGEVVLMILIGGVGTIFGPLFGALVVVAMQNYLAPLGAWLTVSQGLVFVLCVLAFREGIVGMLARRIGRPL